MNIYNSIMNHKDLVSVVGLGYVGLPIAVAFAEKGIGVIGFDIDKMKIKRCLSGNDYTGEVEETLLKRAEIVFTDDEKDLQKARFHIIAVPTPINQDYTPDLQPLIRATEAVGRNMKAGSIVVFESTVYPGVTENICCPILEEQSGLKCGEDFKIGYSPERINPGDRNHKLSNIVKIVSGCDVEALNQISAVYSIIVEAGTYRVRNIRTAEAIKVVENAQRDVNIAFINEISVILERMEIDTNEVVDGMNTKWNALGFRPGIVGGHCIGVDPYYLIYAAERIGSRSDLLKTSRAINDAISNHIVDYTIKQLVHLDKPFSQCRVCILGFTFKEDCPDIRNTQVFQIYKHLQEYGLKPIVSDSVADAAEVRSQYNIKLVDRKEIRDADCIIFAVAHDEYRRLTIEDICRMFQQQSSPRILIDVKGIYSAVKMKDRGFLYWHL